MALSHVVRALTADRPRSSTVIHWIVREEEIENDPASLDCLYPSRLRSGAIEDGEESHHVPLSDPLPLPEDVPLAQIGPGPLQAWPGVRARANRR